MSTETRELLAQFQIPNKTLTGEREITDLSDVDTAFGNYILEIFTGIRITDQRRESDPFRAFLARDPKDRVFVGEYDTPMDLVNAITKAKEGRKGEHGKNINHNALPVIHVSRSVDFGMFDTDAYIDIENIGTLVRTEGTARQLAYAIVNKSFVKFTYTVVLISDEKHSLSMMSTTLATYMRRSTRKRTKTFQAKTRLGGAPVMLNTEVEFPMEVSFASQSVSRDEGRLYANAIAIDVVSEILEAEFIEPVNTTVRVYGSVLHER
ncbi:MAG TPA: hypothetical protein VGL07_16960 [Buttiauxella sp.]|jgi:hypothetical protein